MKYEIEKEKVADILEDLKELGELMDERISDLHEIKGMMQARHAYVFYRKLIWELRDNFIGSLTEIK